MRFNAVRVKIRMVEVVAEAPKSKSCRRHVAGSWSCVEHVRQLRPRRLAPREPSIAPSGLAHFDLLISL